MTSSVRPAAFAGAGPAASAVASAKPALSPVANDSFGANRIYEAAELEMIKTVIEGYEAERKEHLESWRSIDAKALAVVTISGVFLAAVHTMATDAPKQMPEIFDFGIALSSCLLVASALFAASVFWPRRVSGVPYGGATRMLANGVLTSEPSERQRRAAAFQNEMVDIWTSTNRKLYAWVRGKGLRLNFAMWLLVAAIGCFGIMTAVTLG